MCLDGYELIVFIYFFYQLIVIIIRFLRSSNEKLLKIQKQKLKSFGQRSFSFVAPSLELTASHSKKCTNIIPVQISPKNLVCPGFPVESSTLSEKKVSVCSC